MGTKTLSQTIKQRKHQYWLQNDESGHVISVEDHYNDDLAIMAAMRTLIKMKKNGASLWLSLEPYGCTQIQGFYRKD